MLFMPQRKPKPRSQGLSSYHERPWERGCMQHSLSALAQYLWMAPSLGDAISTCQSLFVLSQTAKKTVKTYIFR